MLKFALLGFLNYGPLTGYELERYMNVSTGNFWHATLSQIYMTLKKLDTEGLVQSQIEPQTGKPDRRVYTITDAGRADLVAWLNTPLVEPIVKKDALLLRVFFSTPAQKDQLLAQLYIQLDLHRQQLARYQHDSIEAAREVVTRQPELETQAVLWELTRRYGEQYEATYIAWIEEAIETIRRFI